MILKHKIRAMITMTYHLKTTIMAIEYFKKIEVLTIYKTMKMTTIIYI